MYRMFSKKLGTGLTAIMERLLRPPRRLIAHHLWFALFSILSLLVFGSYFRALIRLSLGDERYSHILLIPFISASLLYLQRSNIFVDPRYCFSRSALLLIAGVALFRLAKMQLSTDLNDDLSVSTLAIILVWMAGFVLCYGAKSFQTSLFPLLFLLLMIPIPTFALNSITSVLQNASAIVSYVLFRLFSVPVFWQHFKFLLPGVTIEIAAECSGIRSSLALFITSILTGYVFLQFTWRRVFFSLLTIPVVILKNAIRIVTISCLGVYVDQSFLHGRLHRYGGLPFSLLSLAILIPFLLALQKGERGRCKTTASEVVSQNAPSQIPAF